MNSWNGKHQTINRYFLSGKRIYLDMDGVLADCSKNMIIRLLDILQEKEPKTLSRDFLLSHHELDTYFSSGLNCPGTVFAKSPFAKHYFNKYKSSIFSDEFFENLPVIDGAIEAVEKLVSFYGPSNIFFLTAPPSSGSDGEFISCWVGKAKWLKKHFSHLGVEKNIILTKHKYACCRPGDILFDDREYNILEWESAGGVGILVEDRPSISILCYKIEDYQSEYKNDQSFASIVSRIFEEEF